MDYALNNMNKQKLKLTSYNCKNFSNSGPKFEFINKFNAECDFVFLQEHWLYESEFGKLSEINGDSGVVATSAMDESVERLGRAYGGCAFIWNLNIKGKIIKVDINNNCLCGVKFILNGMLFVMLNEYMPCDRRIEDPEYMDLMNMIQQLIQSLNPTFIIHEGTLTLTQAEQLLICMAYCSVYRIVLLLCV